MAARAGVTPFRTFVKNWYEPAAIPIYVTVGVACAGAGWYLARLANSKDIIWSPRGNPTPWNSIEPGSNTKLMAINKEFFAKNKNKSSEEKLV